MPWLRLLGLVVALLPLTAFTIFGSEVADSEAATITTSAGANGMIAPSGAVSVPECTNQTFSISRNKGRDVLCVLADGASPGAVSGSRFARAQSNDIGLLWTRTVR